MNVSIDNLADAIMNELETYSNEVAVASKKAVEQTAKECKEDISQHAPHSKGKNGGKYAGSWRTKQAYLSSTESRITVYSTRYQLTHLLEYGHEKWLWGNYTGQRVKAIPHIRPAEERAEQRLVERIKRAL